MLCQKCWCASCERSWLLGGRPAPIFTAFSIPETDNGNAALSVYLCCNLGMLTFVLWLDHRIIVATSNSIGRPWHHGHTQSHENYSCCRLCTTFGFSLPAVGESRARKIAALQNKIIAQLADETGEGLTVDRAMAN